MTTVIDHTNAIQEISIIAYAQFVTNGVFRMPSKWGFAYHENSGNAAIITRSFRTVYCVYGTVVEVVTRETCRQMKNLNLNKIQGCRSRVSHGNRITLTPGRKKPFKNGLKALSKIKKPYEPRLVPRRCTNIV